MKVVCSLLQMISLLSKWIWRDLSDDCRLNSVACIGLSLKNTTKLYIPSKYRKHYNASSWGGGGPWGFLGYLWELCNSIIQEVPNKPPRKPRGSPQEGREENLFMEKMEAPRKPQGRREENLFMEKITYTLGSTMVGLSTRRPSLVEAAIGCRSS